MNARVGSPDDVNYTPCENQYVDNLQSIIYVFYFFQHLSSEMVVGEVISAAVGSLGEVLHGTLGFCRF